MTQALREFLRQHPILREALWWSVPALVLGFLFRALLLSYLPCAMWGADSRSHFSFAYRLIVQHGISLDEKRRKADLFPTFE